MTPKPRQAWLDLVARRPLVEEPIEAMFALGPGDRALVKPQDTIVPGAPIVEHLRDPRVEVVSLRDGEGPAPEFARPGDRWSGRLPIRWRRRHGSTHHQCRHRLTFGCTWCPRRNRAYQR